MENKLTLENIAPFLPYGLKAFKNVNIENELVTIEGFADDKTYGYVFLFFRNETIKSVGNYDIKYFKPVLRKMDLTKPITVEGKQILPIVELGLLCYPNEDFELSENKIPNMAISSRFNFEYYKNGFTSYNYLTDCTISVPDQKDLFKWLYKHKFDVDGLFEKGLAIDADSLEINPYNN